MEIDSCWSALGRVCDPGGTLRLWAGGTVVARGLQVADVLAVAGTYAAHRDAQVGWRQCTGGSTLGPLEQSLAVRVVEDVVRTCAGVTDILAARDSQMGMMREMNRLTLS